MHGHYDYVCVAFYTIDTPYADYIQDLEADCIKHNIPYKFVAYPSTGSWVRNAGLKPLFLLEMLATISRNILYVDADARIRQRPILFDNFSGDLGAHYRRGVELLSGTLYLRNNDRVRALVSAWLEEQKKNPDTWDQKTLDAVIKRTKFPVTNLPAAYTQIFDSMKHHGRPVIEHMQASRKCKGLVNNMLIKRKIPPVLGSVRVREAQDGTYFISRHDAKAIAYLDKHATRCPGQLRWMPIFNEQLQIKALREHFDGKQCYIVGKGPSLDHLRKEHFRSHKVPVICLNESIYQVEKLGLANPIFGLQQDASLRNRCLPADNPLFVSVKAANFYAGCENIYIFDSRHYRLSLNSLSVSAAICIAKSLGCLGFQMLCFDACVNKKLEYANCIGYDATWGGAKRRFLTHLAKIEARAGGLPTRFIIPEAPVEEASDKSLQ